MSKRMITNLRRTTVRAFALGVVAGAFLAVGIVAAAPADADGYLDDMEADYVNMYGSGAICPIIDRHRTDGVMGAAEGITDDGFAADAAVDIINASVWLHCPRNWPLLVAIGNSIRSDSTTA
jgi:hypothetical protein